VRKSVPLTVLFCPACEAVWQWRGQLSEGEVACPSCRHNYDPKKGNVPQKGKFRCSCGQQDDIIAGIRTLPEDQRLPMRPYAVQAYIFIDRHAEADDASQGTFFEDQSGRPLIARHSPALSMLEAAGLLIPANGKFFKRFTVSDMRRLQQAEALWEQHREGLPYPKSAIPQGYNTNQMIKHNYRYWANMFSSRQLLALSTLLQGIMAEQQQSQKEALLSAFMMTTEANNLFTWQIKARKTPGGSMPGGVLRRHEFAPKIDICEQNVWGIVSGNNTFTNRMQILKDAVDFASDVYDLAYSDSEDKVLPHQSPERFQIPDKYRGYCADMRETISFVNGAVAACVTDPPYVGNVNYSELADFFYVWLRLALKDKYAEFQPEYSPKSREIVENRTRGKSREDFYTDLSAGFQILHDRLTNDGLLVFTFHHTDPEGKIWEGLLRSICETGFEFLAVYPIHGEREESLHLQDKENISYDLIHVCRKRQDDPQSRSWAGIRQQVRRKAREELEAIEQGRYGNQPLTEPDVRLICIGKCLELYSAHYGKVLDHENKPLPLHKALQDISAIVDQLVTKDRPLPSELEAVDGLSYVWLRVLAPIRNEVMMDAISKSARGMQVSLDVLKEARLVVRGRIGRGRTYEVKQPAERLGELVGKYQPGLKLRATQGELFTSEGQTIFYDIPLVDLIHLVIGLAQAGESVVPWLERFAGLRSQLGAALRYLRDIRADWKEPIERVLALIEGAPLIRQMENA
jgi:putative DNA methylase